MQVNRILSAPLLDLIFIGRNKEYGAYELRRKYGSRILKALLITMLGASAISLLLLNAPQYKEKLHVRIIPGVVIQEIRPVQKMQESKKPEQARPRQKAPATVINNTPVVKPDPQVHTTVASQAELAQALPGNTGNSHGGQPGYEQPGPQPQTTTPAPVRNISEGPALTVDLDARFDGNWKRFLESNLDASVPLDHRAPAGRYSVVIRFVVDIDGTISDIEPLTRHGYGLEEEAIRVIRRSKKWEPARLHGSAVKAFKKQVVVFDVVEE